LTALVSAVSILPQGATEEPAWPFVRLGATVTQPVKASGTAGANVSIDIHAFARPLSVASQVVDTAEDHAAAIGAAVEAALANNRLALETGAIAHIALSDIQLMPDEEPESFHWFAQVNVRIFA
jgi:GNAT superfamily N-acetyltransferase